MYLQINEVKHNLKLSYTKGAEVGLVGNNNLKFVIEAHLVLNVKAYFARKNYVLFSEISGKWQITQARKAKLASEND